MTRPKPKLVDPEHLGPSGKALWDSTTTKYELTDPQKIILLEACRCKDLIDQIHEGLEKTSSLLEVVDTPDENFEVRVDKAIASRISLSALMAKHIAQLRLGQPALTGAGNPGGARGADGAHARELGNVTALDRVRQRSR